MQQHLIAYICELMASEDFEEQSQISWGELLKMLNKLNQGYEFNLVQVEERFKGIQSQAEPVTGFTPAVTS